MARGQRASVGDTRWSPNGYHYTRTEGGWVLTHRLTAERKLGRPLRSNERCRITGNKKTDYNNPDKIEVYEVRQKSNASRRAQLEAKIEELQAELAELEEQDSA